MTPTVRAAGAGFSLLLAVLGTAAAVVGSGYGVTGDDGRVGAGFLPVVFGATVALLAVVDVAQRLLRRDDGASIADVAADLAVDGEQATAADDVADEADGDVDIFGRTQRQRTRILAAVIAGLVVAVLLVPVIGFILSFTLLMLGIAVGLERRPVVPSVIVCAVAAAVIWLVFRQLLSVPLPTGLLGIL